MVVSHSKALERIQQEFTEQQRKNGYSPIAVGQVTGWVRKYKDPPEYTIVDYTRLSQFAVIMRKRITNKLGLDDMIYYYLNYRTYWGNRWASVDFGNFPKYDRKEGVMINIEVGNRIIDEDNGTGPSKQQGREERKGMEQSVIVIGIINVPDDTYLPKATPELWYCPAKDAIDFQISHPCYETPWHTKVFGLPKSMFTRDDPFS